MKFSRLSEAAKAKAAGQPFLTVDVEKLKPGKKTDLKLKLAQQLHDDVDHEIRSLQTKLYHLKHFKEIPQATKVEGLLANLKALEEVINDEIMQLNSVETPPEVEKLLEKIATECSESVAAIKKAKKFLYRGTSGPDVFVGRSWDKRHTKDSSSEAQKFFDQNLAAQGFVALRSNSIFTTSDASHAEGFGELYFIFPIDGKSAFSYTNRGDLTLDSVSEVPINQEIKKKIVDWIDSNSASATEDKQKSLLRDMRSRITWEDDPVDIIKIVKSVSYKTLNVPEEFKSLTLSNFIDIVKFNKEYKPAHTDLKRALKHELEVYVHGAYYAVNYSKYKKFVFKFFNIKLPNDDDY